MIFYNARIFEGKTMTKSCAIEVEDGVVTSLPDRRSGDIDLGGSLVAPGLIDAHTHGYGGFDTMAGPEAISSLAKLYASAGTTAFFPTSVSASMADTIDFVSSVRSARSASGGAGARILGAHLEGPFLSAGKRGAHGEMYLMPPTLENFDAITGGDSDTVARITIAPELDKNLALTKALTARGIAVSAGHTEATGEETLSAIEAGITTCVHYFNAMQQLRHRETNFTSTGLTDGRMVAEFIPDLLHISNDAIRIILSCKGEGGCYICTDSLPCAGLADGDYNVGPIEVSISSGEIYTRGPVRALAGSSITMLEGVRRLVLAGIDVQTALRLGTANVAETYNLKLGRLLPGYPADFIVLDDGLSLRAVYMGGTAQEPVIAISPRLDPIPV